MKALVLLAALSANDITLSYENFVAEHGISTITLKVTNTGSTMARHVFIDCVFFDENDKAIDIGRVLVTDLAPGRSKYDQARIPTTDGVKTASCYVDKLR